jgi:anti-sigma B factor antagonist
MRASRPSAIEVFHGHASEGTKLSVEISIRDAGSVRILDASGRITIGESSDRLHQALRDLADQGWRKILVNLTDVAQIDSSGISALVRNSISIGRAGGSLRLLVGSGRVRDTLTVTRLVEAIPTFSDEATALSSFG